MREIMFTTLALATITAALMGSLAAVERIKSDTAAVPLTSVAKDLSVPAQKPL